MMKRVCSGDRSTARRAPASMLELARFARYRPEPRTKGRPDTWISRAAPGAAVLALWFVMISAVGGLCGPEDSVMITVPREVAFSGGGFDSCYGFEVSPQDIFLILPARGAGDLLSGTAALNLRPRSHLPLWIAGGSLPDGVLEGAGAHPVYRSESITVFEADMAGAHGLLSRGYKIVEGRVRSMSNLKRPALGETMLADLLARRPLTAQRRSFMSGLADSVDTLRLRQTLHHLTYDDAENLRSRYACRIDLKRDITPFIVEELTQHLGAHGGDIRVVPCLPKVWQCPDLPPDNVVADKPGKMTGAHYIICAHYDAIASRQPLWDWEVDPAPGADDNGTGVAVLLECARLLAGLELDVSLKFIAFSGEELGLKGSKCYADSVGLGSEADSILGVINIDMVGYLEDRPKLEIVYDWKSKWLSDQLVKASDIAGVESEVEDLDLTGIPMSDHFPFWQIGIPGILFIEELEGIVPVNPNYHTLGDVLEILDMGQVGDNTRTIVSFLARFAALPEDTLPDVELTEGSVQWDWEGRYGPEDFPVAGDNVTARVRALNMGASMDGPTAYTFEIWCGRRMSGEQIHQRTEMLDLLTGEYAEIDFTWATDPKMHGPVAFTFVLEPLPPDLESDITNNAIEVTLEFMSQAAVLENLHVFPNPVTSQEGAYIAFDIYHPDGDFNGMMDLWIYDILGSQVGHGSLERSHAKHELEIGRNALSLKDFVASGSDLPPGLYICISKLRILRSPKTFEATFKFAVDR